jgi:hypothetical protein
MESNIGLSAQAKIDDRDTLALDLAGGVITKPGLIESKDAVTCCCQPDGCLGTFR